MTWTMKDLEYWDQRIREKVGEAGLDCFPQEFEVCDHNQMLGYMAYSGMPAHYPHWSYGKSFERQKTLYDYGVSGLPYEMVINSNPSLAYLMKDNSLLLQILTIAHVYGHNDFFKNNFTFRHTEPELVFGRFKAFADRVRSYVEDPSIGIEKVERILDSAHALSLQCRRNLAIQKNSPESRAASTHGANGAGGEVANQRPNFEPEEDLLLFIRDNNPFLAEWEKDLLTIVHEQSRYFLPQIETKIMNEGWASYFHHWILKQLDLPSELHMEFLVNHSQVIRPHNGQINPYHLGFLIWHDIERRWDQATPQDDHGNPDLAQSGREKMFEVRETDRDASFLRRFLTPELMRELDMFQYEEKGEDYVVTEVSDEDHWKSIRQALVSSVGMSQVPVIKIEDCDLDNGRVLCLNHYHEGRDLEVGYAQRTLEHLHVLWGKKVVLETIVNEAPLRLGYSVDGFFKEELARNVVVTASQVEEG